jgi:hypothetical protein
MNVIPDKKLIDAVCEGFSDEEKAFTMLLFMLAASTPSIQPEDIIPLPEEPLSHDLVFPMDYIYTKK